MTGAPFFSICIPQHNRTSFVLEAIRSIERQTFRDLEICVSDDCSTDGRDAEIARELERSGLRYHLGRQTTNGRYDRNLRAAMDLATGKYLLLLGNDDALKEDTTLQRLHDALRGYPGASVLVANFEDFATGAETRRIRATRFVAGSPDAAVRSFRKFSFVSGIVLDRVSAERAQTEAWDGSEMYQMYVGCRVIAAGAGLLELDLSTIRKDIQISGEAVDAFTRRPREVVRGVPAQPLPITRVAALVADAIGPYLTTARRRVLLRLVVQYYGFLCPYWVLVYRRVQSWRYAAGVARAFAPSASFQVKPVPLSVRAAAWALFLASSFAALVAPVRASDYLFRPARRLARAASEMGRVVEAERT